MTRGIATNTPSARLPVTGVPKGMARLLAPVGFALLLVLSGIASGEDDDTEADLREAVFGIWASTGTMIEVSPAADGGLSARIIALKNPNWREKDRVGVVGEPKTDLHNPEESRRDRPLLGLEILSNYRFERGRWHGRVYLPTNGSSWTSTARVRNGNLLIRGFLGVSLLGRTQTFAPLAACTEDILRMIETAGMRDTPCDDKLENAR